MKISPKYSDSILSHFLAHLFGPKEFMSLADSRFGRFFSRIENPILAEVSVLFSIALIFYKDLLGQYLSFNFGNLVPIFLLLAIFFIPKKALVINKATLWLGSFFVLMVVSGTLAMVWGLSPRIVLLGWLLFAHFLLAFWAGQGVGKTRVNMAIIAVSMPAAMYGIWQYFTGAANSALWFSQFEHLNSTRAFAWFGSPNVFGIVMAFVAALSFFELWSKRKYVFGLTLLISLVGLFASLSRSAWLAFVIAMGISLVIINYKYLFLAPLGLILLALPSIRNRILALANPQYSQDSSLDGRIWAIKDGLYIWAKKPFIGFGPGSYGGQIAQNYASPVYLLGMQNGYTPIYFTDNQWLELLVQGGIIGLLTFFSFLVSAFWQILVNFKREKNLIFLGSLAVLIIFAFSGVAANVLEFGAVAIPAGLVIGSAMNET